MPPDQPGPHALAPSQRPSETIALHLYTTAPYPCSYLTDRIARSQVASPARAVDESVYPTLVRQGFRRSGEHTYRPQCPACDACQSLRVVVDDFSPNRSQRRAWRQHAALRPQVRPLHFDGEHHRLYQRYQRARHPGGDMDSDDPAQYADFLLSSQVQTWLITFHEPPATPHGPAPTHSPAPDGTLRMVSIVDVLDDGLSAVYTFYDPDTPAPGQPRPSYGTWAILWQIALTRRLGLPYLYLGYWIEGSKKMKYKQQFRPHHILRHGQWQPGPPA